MVTDRCNKSRYIMLTSAKGAVRTSNGTRNNSAPHSVLRVFLTSAKGAVRTSNGTRNNSAPHSVLRVFLKDALVAGVRLYRLCRGADARTVVARQSESRSGRQLEAPAGLHVYG